MSDSSESKTLSTPYLNTDPDTGGVWIEVVPIDASQEAIADARRRFERLRWQAHLEGMRFADWRDEAYCLRAMDGLGAETIAKIVMKPVATVRRALEIDGATHTSIKEIRQDRAIEKIDAQLGEETASCCTAQEIVDAVKVPLEYAQNYLRQHGKLAKPRGRGRPITQEEIAQYIAMREQGISMEEIGAKFDRDPESVRLRLKGSGYSSRRIRKIRIEGDIAYVPLTQGKEAVIDAADVPLISDRNWQWGSGSTSETGYAVSARGRGQKTIQMHNVIVPPPSGLRIDHKDHNGLNNRRENLRPATRRQNMLNTRSKRGASGHRCVYLDKRNGSFYYKRVLSAGGFKTAEEAWEAFKERIRVEEGSSEWLTNKEMPPREESS